MKPKEKAMDLINKFQHPLSEESDTDCLHIEVAKEFALLSIDEIMLSRKNDSEFDDTLWAGGSDMYTMHPMYLKYWIEVKKEIYKL